MERSDDSKHCSTGSRSRRLLPRHLRPGEPSPPEASRACPPAGRRRLQFRPSLPHPAAAAAPPRDRLPPAASERRPPGHAHARPRAGGPPRMSAEDPRTRRTARRHPHVPARPSQTTVPGRPNHQAHPSRPRPSPDQLRVGREKLTAAREGSACTRTAGARPADAEGDGSGTVRPAGPSRGTTLPGPGRAASPVAPARVVRASPWTGPDPRMNRHHVPVPSGCVRVVPG